jgi:hypothetical protein
MTGPRDEDVVVRITLADIYQQLVALAASVNAALARADRAEQVLAEHETELRPLAGAADRIIDHESRLRSLERGRWPLPALTIVIALASLVLAVGVAIDGK